MLTIVLPEEEFYDPATNEFVMMEERVLRMEHSLLSVSKWEAETKKAFMGTEKTPEETLAYIRCMCLDPADDRTLARLTNEDLRRINDYLEDPMTATTFGAEKSPPRRKKTTAEEIYCLMAQLGVPFECENWHFNRLTALLKVCSIRSGPQTKVKRGDLLKRQAALNAARRKKSGSRG